MIVSGAAGGAGESEVFIRCFDEERERERIESSV